MKVGLFWSSGEANKFPVIQCHFLNLYLTNNLYRECPSGNALFEVEVPVRTFRPTVLTNDATLLVVLGHERNRDFMHVFQSQTGILLHKFIPRYQGAKRDQAGQLIPIPGKQTQIALMDQDKGITYDHI